MEVHRNTDEAKYKSLECEYNNMVVAEKSNWVKSFMRNSAHISMVKSSHLAPSYSVTTDRRSPDVVVVSSVDPETAISLCEKLRSRVDGALVLCTDRDDEVYQRRAYSAGVDECVLKPISEALLQAKLSAWQRRVSLIRRSKYGPLPV